jgi:hypothetical protein
MLADPCDLGLRERTTSSGQRLWREDDPVHLTKDGYRDIAHAITESVVAGPADLVSTTGSTSGSQKRKRAESVVTKQQQPLAKKATPVPRTAGWLLGRIENSAERGYRGSAMRHGGWSRGRGGRFGGPVGYDRAGRAGRAGRIGGSGGWHGGRRSGWHRRGAAWSAWKN